jgi:hypothetical protein
LQCLLIIIIINYDIDCLAFTNTIPRFHYYTNPELFIS